MAKRSWPNGKEPVVYFSFNTLANVIAVSEGAQKKDFYPLVDGKVRNLISYWTLLALFDREANITLSLAKYVFKYADQKMFACQDGHRRIHTGLEAKHKHHQNSKKH